MSDSSGSPAAVLVIRKGEGATVEKMKGFAIEYLIQTDTFEMLRVRVEPGGETQSLSHQGEESHLVISGELEVTVDARTYLLREGDSIWYRSTSPHKWRNSGSAEVVVYSIAFPRTYASLLIKEVETLGKQGACPA